VDPRDGRRAGSAGEPAISRSRHAVGTCTLENPGDYIVWGPGVEHTWQAEADSTMLAIRWPSIGS
jgi:hypothetical protein